MSRAVVLVTGASGLVGTWLRKTVPGDVELVACAHRASVAGARSVTADLRERDGALAAVRSTRPSIIIHAAMAPDSASIVDATRNVMEAASLVGADLIYLSTDAVFSGDGCPLDENASPDPVWPYGQWKATAEALASGARPGTAVVRLPLVVSTDPEDGAVERIRRGAAAKVPTRWFHDQTRQPAMAVDLARAIWEIARMAPERRGGAWHLPGPEQLTRYEIARRVAEALGLDRSSIIRAATPSDHIRPRHLNMLCERARSQIGWKPSRILR